VPDKLAYLKTIKVPVAKVIVDFPHTIETLNSSQISVDQSISSSKELVRSRSQTMFKKGGPARPYLKQIPEQLETGEVLKVSGLLLRPAIDIMAKPNK